MDEEPAIDEKEREELVAYLDGELEGRAAAELEARLARSETLRREASTIQGAYDLLDFLPMPATTPDFTRRTVVFVERPGTKERLGGTGRKRRWMGVLTGAGFLVGILAAFFAGWRFTSAASDPHRQLLDDLPVIERFEEYRVARDLDLLRALHDQRVLDQLDQALDGSEPSEPR